MGQNTSSVRSKGLRRGSFRGFSRRSKLNRSNLSHTFNLAPSAEEYTELMNINTATEEQLMTLPGINRQLAREIVRHRQMIGRFKRVDDLALVSGIGAERLELLRPEICTNRKQASRTSSCSLSSDSIRSSERSESRLCSVNSSSVFQLQCVPGLNQEIAANIVDYRNKKGPFKSLDDLIKVRGMDRIRLSTVKPHLTLDNRKCESVHNISNGYSNGSVDLSFTESMFNGVVSTPKPTVRKCFSAPIKYPALPNGFANTPVNDILDLLSAYSHRPIVEEVFKYERDGVRCCRLASWNLHQLSVDKIMNPGVREVVCRTILENKLSLIAIQDVIEEDAVKILRDELNTPSLRRVKEWSCNSHMWEYCISGPMDGKYLGFVYDSANNKGITIEDIDLDHVCLLTENAEVKTLVKELAVLRSERFIAAPQAFLLCGRPIVLVNVHCRARLSEQDRAKLQAVVELAAKTDTQVALMGEMLTWDNVHSLKSCEPLQKEGVTTTLDNSEGRSVILTPPESNFNGHSGVIKVGLSHLAIPRGWSWGGPASPYCPVWAEIKVPD